MPILTAMLAVVLLIGLPVFLGRRYPVGAIAAIGSGLTHGVPPTTDAVALLTRWRDRAARWRSMSALPVVLGTVVASIALRGELGVGVGAHPAWSDPLLTGFLSVFLGAIAAELHHLRTRARGPRAVELRPRDVEDYLPVAAHRRRLVLVALAVVAVALTATVAASFPATGALALVIAALVPAVQRGIVGRARPAMADDLRAADDAVRRLAVRSVDEAGAGAVLLLTAWQLAPVYAAVDVPPVVTIAMVVGQVGALVVAVVWWRRSNPKRLLPDVLGTLEDGDRAGSRS